MRKLTLNLSRLGWVARQRTAHGSAPSCLLSWCICRGWGGYRSGSATRDTPPAWTRLNPPVCALVLLLQENKVETVCIGTAALAYENGGGGGESNF